MMSAEDEQQLGRIAGLHRARAYAYAEDEEDESHCPSPLKRIGPALACALTLAFILFTMLASAPPVPPQTHSQTATLHKGGERDEQVLMGWREERRLSAGPGSHPPSCKSKCGRCVPCKPVRVPIHPGRDRPMEYYPEAWRCKCGNKLYMP